MATIKQAHVLDRVRGTFTNDKGETIGYAQAVLVDTETRDLLVLSADENILLRDYEPGTTVGPLEVEVAGSANVRAVKVRPVGGASGRERF